MSGKRILGRAAVLVALGAAVMTPRARAQSVVVGPLPSSMSALPGASITVPVVADLTSSGGASLGSAVLRLTWHAGTLTYVSTSPGTLSSPTVNVDNAAGLLRVAVANPAGATGMPVLFNATFNVTGAPSEATTLGLSVDEITAAGTFADLRPITVTTQAHFCTSTGLWGDVDGDGVFTGHDALIMLTYAVGLPFAPYSVVNGDVDGSGAVDSRDALIVLSAAVGIPVTQFRIGHINAGLCSLRSASSVQIQPRTATVAPGDSLPVTAVVEDSTGALVQGVGLVWQSKDPTVMRPGGGGSLIAVAPGTTYALVYVQPGVKDSVLVTVTSTRHVWYVNPMIAANNLGVELGSQLYPYASIDTAMAHAAANDTVRVAVADYGPVRITKPLTMIGDVTAAGYPRLASTTASPPSPALRVGPVLVGAVTIHGLRLVNSQKGLVADSVQTLVLESVSVEGSRDLGLRVYGADSVMLSHVSVIGAVGGGVELDSARAAALDHVTSDAITSSQGASGPPLALKIAQVMTLSGDSVTLGSAGAFVDSAGAVTLRRMRVANSAGSALRVNGNSVSVVASDFSGATGPGGGTPSAYTVALNAGGALEGPPQGAIRFDSSKVHNSGLWGLSLTGGATVSLRGDTVAGNYSGSANDESSAIYNFGRLHLAQTAFVKNGPGYVDIEGFGTDSVAADSTVFDGTDAYVYDVAAFRMRFGTIRNASAPALYVESTPAVELDSVEVSGNNISQGFNPAVWAWDADTVAVNGINAHDNASGALEVENGAALRVSGGSMLNNGFGRYGEATRFTVQASNVTDTRIYGLTLRDSTDVGILISPSGISRTVVDSSFLEGSGTLVQDRHCCSVAGDTLIVSRSSLTGFGGSSEYGVDAELLAKLAVTGSFMDSLYDDGVHTQWVGTVTVSQDTIRAWSNVGIQVANASLVTADSNTLVGCGWAAVQARLSGPTSVTGNSLTGCGPLPYVQGQNGNSGPRVQVFGNTLTLDTTSMKPGVYLTGGLGYVEVAGNTILGGGAAGIVIGTNYNLDSARVDSNTVQQTHGNGIQVSKVAGRLSLLYNLASDNRGYGLFLYSPFTADSNTVVRNDSGGVADSSYGTGYFRSGNLVGNVHYGAATFISTLYADSNWWGDTRGPSCGVELCDPASTGDAVSGSLVSFTPRDSIGPVAGAPAIPSPPHAPVARLLASRALAVPRPPKTLASVTRPGTAPQAAAQAMPAAPRPVRPTGRPTGHHRPAWKTERLR